MHKIHSVETVCTYPNKISSPIETIDGVYLVSQNGDILRYNEGSLVGQFIIIGQPSSIAHNPTEGQFFVCDFAHQSIVSRKGKEHTHELSNEISNYKGQHFIGPHSIIISETEDVYFTDSGPFLQTSIQNPKGSVFLYTAGEKKVIPLAYRCLAYPTGLALHHDFKSLYVCEMAKNRIIRFMLDNDEGSSYSTFYQFNGRFGPSAICLRNDMLYVANFEFKQLATKGMISVLNLDGEFIESFELPSPEISGISFSLNYPRVMYVTDNSTKGSLLKVTFKGDKSEDKEEGKDT